jgi:hypothetical protein
MSSSCRRLCAALGSAVLLGAGARPLLADNWELLPRLEAGANYNDNYRMADTPADELQVYGPYIDAQLSAALISQRAKLQIVPRVRSDYFPTDHRDQSTDGYLDVNGDYTTLRSDFGGVAQYSDETVIYSELLAATFPGVALGQVEPGVSGLVSERNRRQLARAAPHYSYDITERTHLNLTADYTHVSYQKSLPGEVGYNSYQGSGGVGFSASQRSVFTVTGLADHFVPQTGSQPTNRYGLSLRWDFMRSQIMHYYARLGVSHTQAEVPGTAAHNGLTGGMGVDLRYEVTEVTLDALRDFAPSAAGAVVITDQARFRVLHAFEPRFSGFVGVNALRESGQSSQPGLAIAGEDNVAAEVGCDYQLTQNYRLEATYDLTWERFQGTPSAHSNAVAVAFIYQPLSRYEPLPELTGIPTER